jgi:hypothetical protein
MGLRICFWALAVAALHPPLLLSLLLLLLLLLC